MGCFIRFLVYGWVVAVVCLAGYLMVPVFVPNGSNLAVGHWQTEIQHGLWLGFIGVSTIMIIPSVIMVAVVATIISASDNSNREGKE